MGMLNPTHSLTLDKPECKSDRLLRFNRNGLKMHPCVMVLFRWCSTVAALMYSIYPDLQLNYQVCCLSDIVSAYVVASTVCVHVSSIGKIDAPCGLQGCKNRPAPFPGRMSYNATKPGSVCRVS